MCLQYSANWKLKSHINYKIYYAQYHWFPDHFPPNTLNNDNTIIYYSYMYTLKITDNLKIKYHIWRKKNPQSFPLWWTMLRPRFKFPYHVLLIFLNTHTKYISTRNSQKRFIRKNVSDFLIDLHLLSPLESVKNGGKIISRIYCI